MAQAMFLPRTLVNDTIKAPVALEREKLKCIGLAFRLNRHFTDTVHHKINDRATIFNVHDVMLYDHHDRYVRTVPVRTTNVRMAADQFGGWIVRWYEIELPRAEHTPELLDAIRATFNTGPCTHEYDCCGNYYGGVYDIHQNGNKIIFSMRLTQNV